jgi:hypothetical protein
MATYVRDQEVVHDIGPSGRFVLRVTSPEVEIRAVNGDRATVRVRFELRAGSEEEADQLFQRASFDVRRASDLLEVSEPTRSSSGLGALVRLFGAGGAATDVSVTAEIPAEAEVIYEGVSADVTVTGLVGTQQYRTVSGDMVLDRVGGDLRVRDVSGDVSLRAEVPVRLEMNAVSGDVSAVAPRFDALRIVTVSGDIELDGALPPGTQHRIETVSGDLSFGVAGGLVLEVRGLSSETHITVPHRSEGTRDRRRYVIGGGEANLAFSSMSGDASIHPSRRISAPIPPPAPAAPAAPAAPTAPAAPAAAAVPADEQLAILRALEAGEIDVEEATARLAGGSRGA